jgi:putative membrane protein
MNLSSVVKYLASLLGKSLSVFSYKELPKTFAIFYTVGLVLFILPLSRPLFMAITPLSLLFVNTLLLYHHKKLNLNFFIFFFTVTISSFIVEVIGVKTGDIFGNYIYLSSLGPKILETPVIIGVNWMMLTYCSAAIMHYISKRSLGVVSNIIRITGGAALMTGYDFIAELIAPQMNMWRFDGGTPPALNYLMWFILGLIFHTLFNSLKIKPIGKPAIALFVLQLIFFSLIAAFLYISPLINQLI